MSSSVSQLQFAAELVAMLVAAAGLVLVLLRPELTGSSRWARVALAGGFVAAGVAAFVHGSLLSSSTGDVSRRSIGALRLAGYVSVAAGGVHWRSGLRVRLTLWLGVLLGAVAAVIDLVDGSATAAEVVLIAGSGGVAVALVAASRRSIVARVAAGATATLLLMVLVLSIALSSVIAHSTQQGQLTTLATLARVESGAAQAAGATALQNARFVGADLQGYFRTEPGSLIDLHSSEPGAARSAGATAVSGRLGELAGLYPTEALAYVVGPTLVLGAPTPSVDAPLVALAARARLVVEMTCADSSGQASAALLDGALVAIAAYPECLTSAGASSAVGSGDTLLGVVVVTTPLDDSYLTSRLRLDPTTSLALVTPDGVLAAAGAQPSSAALRAAARTVVGSDRSAVWTESGRQLAAAPVTAATGTPVAVLVASSSDSSGVAVRDRLERTLFLIALGGTVIALLFVAAIGERVTAGLRHMTQVAVRIRRGGAGERADIRTNDEVGALGAAFDAMLASIEDQTGALQAAADAETRLRNRLQAVVAGMGDALVATDSTGVVTDFNAAAERLSGIVAVAALGASIAEVIDVAGAEGAPLGLEAAGAAWSELGLLRRADGVEVPVAVSAGVWRGLEGEPAGRVLVVRDLRREQEIERMKSEFLSRVGHELRTPLTAILGYSEILMSHQPTPAQSLAWHQEIQASAKRLARIVEMLEFVASSGAGSTVLQPEVLDVGGLVRDVVADWSERIGDRHALSKRVARATPAVYADGRWLRLSIDELMDNAVKFSPAGGRIALTVGPGPGGHGVEISVSDQGMGMTAHEQALVFGEFVQGDGSDTRRFGGLGLGLALVQRVVEGHGGEVSCLSTPGGGTRVILWLPALAMPVAENTANGREKHPVPVAQSPSRGPK